MQICSLIFVFMLSSTLIAGGACPLPVGKKAVIIPKKSDFHLYLLMGQSNMVGRGLLKKQAEAKNPRILKLNKENKWEIAADPLHFDNPRAGIGPGMSFAESLMKAENDSSVTIGLIPCAVGGSQLSLWTKDRRLYKAAVVRARKAMETGTLEGVLWHQGESDSKKKEKADSYLDRLSRMISDFRKDIKIHNLPFIVGEIGKFVETNKKFPFAKKVNEQIRRISNKVCFTDYVDSNGLGHIGDCLHFNAESQKKLGSRYAKKMTKVKFEIRNNKENVEINIKTENNKRTCP